MNYVNCTLPPGPISAHILESETIQNLPNHYSERATFTAVFVAGSKPIQYTAYACMHANMSIPAISRWAC